MTKSQKSLRKADLVGSQEPTFRIAPERTSTEGDIAVKLLKAGGISADPWQADVLSDWTATDETGHWVSGTCGGSVPRQNGKTLLLQGRADHGMIKRAETVIYTAHLQKTATETFNEMRDYFETPALIKRVKEIKSALGREQIILKNGGKIKFIARTRNGGRGQHGDLLIFDEAQELDETAQSSFIPAISASSNPQIIYVGTPPDDEAAGVVFERIRNKAKAGNSKISWFEYSVEEIGNVLDQQRWAETNPALGRRMLLSTIQTEVEQMSPEEFARERLGWWKPPKTDVVEIDYAIDRDKWLACASDDMKPEGKTAYGVKFTADGTEIVLCGAVIPTEGAARISLIDRKPAGFGTRWLADWLNARYDKASAVAIDGRNGVDVLIDKIADTWRFKGSVMRVGSRDMVAAVGLLINDINEQALTWYRPQEELDKSAQNAVKRSIGQGWGFGGEDSAPIEAAALALWAAKTSKRDPTRKMRIG